MAYGITGDLDNSEATLRYGVSKDPDYPMFYYNLGCVYAERGDMDKAMSYLSKAFPRRANSIPGEGMPDPRRMTLFSGSCPTSDFESSLTRLPPPTTENSI
jgi:tetratricopeptide (TPR) repeat protein